MGLLSRVIKSAGAPDEDGEMAGGSVDEQPGRPTMHGRTSQWNLRVAEGNRTFGYLSSRPRTSHCDHLPL